MNRRFGKFFSDLWKSASDLRFYQEVAALPFGAAFRHLLTVAGFFGTVLAVIAVVQLIFLNNLLLWCRDNLPPVTILDGEARAEVAQPHLVERRVGDKANFAVIIDTTGKTDRVDPRYSGGVLIKRRAIVFKLGETSIERNFGEMRNLSIDRNYFSGLTVGYTKMAFYIAGLYGALVLVLFAQSAAAALIGKVVALLRGSRRSFRAILQMSIYALALAVCVLFFVLFMGIGLQPRCVLALYVFIHLAFLIGAVLTSGGDEIAA
ncbi:MAG: DUF1189 family protein [Candidatus Aureabacteria bacterium]|nr:DUF1189 family protein [Candidatus Auribacterota bacterium]